MKQQRQWGVPLAALQHLQMGNADAKQHCRLA